MILTFVFLFCTAVTVQAQNVRQTTGRDNYGDSDNQYPPKPYSFEHEIADLEGNVHFRREQKDENGVVTGSYGYRNVNGLYRTVEYIADAQGYRAQVFSNEPGMDNQDPADVKMNVEPVPPGIQEPYNKPYAQPRPNLPTGGIGTVAPLRPVTPERPVAPIRQGGQGFRGNRPFQNNG